MSKKEDLIVTIPIPKENSIKVEITNIHDEDGITVGDVNVSEHSFSGTFPIGDMSFWEYLEEGDKKYFLIPESTFDIIPYIPADPDSDIQ